MKTEEAIFLLEHTGYDDFNLLEHQIKGRLEAIQVILKENQKLNKDFEDLRNLHSIALNELNELQKENQKYKEIIDKAIEYIETHKRKDEFLELNEWGTRDLLDILKEVE